MAKKSLVQRTFDDKDTPELFTIPGRWARYELQTALLDHLFQSRVRKAPSPHTTKRSFIEHTAFYDWHYENGVVPGGIQLQITAPDTLGVTAESVLLAVMYLVKHHGSFLDPQDLATSDLPLLLKPAGIAAHNPIATLETTRYAVLKTAGLSNDRASYQRLHRILSDLGKIMLTYRNLVTGEEGNDLLFRWQLRTDTDRLLIQVNWRLAGAIFGSYLRAMIDLNERNALHSDPTKSLHRWLSAHLWPGKAEWILHSTLARHIWPIDEEISSHTANTNRVRLHRLKTRIIPEFKALPGWRITDESTGILVHRLQRSDHA